MSALKLQIQEDMKSAMRAKEVARLGTIRMLLAALKQREVDERIELSDADVLQIINKMIKQRRESATQFRAGNRPELAEKEESEIAQLEQYLPQQLSQAEIDQIVQDTIAEVKAVSIKDMGTLMNALRPKLQGKADMAVVSLAVKARLG